MDEPVEAILRRFPLFADLPESDIAQLATMAQPVAIEAGQLLMAEGDDADAFYVVLDGEFEVTKRAGSDEVPVGTAQAGEMLGEMALLERRQRTASVRALVRGRLIKISLEAFETLVSTRPTAALAILRTVSARLRNTESLLRERDKLASLGTLAAGLAHELNNPAAAVRRSATQLGDALDAWERAVGETAGLDLSTAERGVLEDLREELRRRAATASRLDALEASDREEELIVFLDDQGLDDAADLAPSLVRFGWQAADLEELADRLPDEALPAVVRWLASGLTVQTLVSELITGSERISEIVKAVKSYSYLDQAPVQPIDVREGLEDTLVIMRHKLKHGIEVERDFAPDLPRVDAFGSELNQVWTNIIDNAVDAMDGQGHLKLQALPIGDTVVVRLCDDGPGIPEEMQKRIFDPFFTTKEPGKGTGLGLHISHNIVVQRHHGRIRVTSQPGETCFEITLPIHIESAPAPGARPAAGQAPASGPAATA